jgi:hypothetical protein
MIVWRRDYICKWLARRSGCQGASFLDIDLHGFGDLHVVIIKIEIIIRKVVINN